MFKSFIVVLFVIALSCFACSKPESKSDEVVPGDNMTLDATPAVTLDATAVKTMDASAIPTMDSTPVAPVPEQGMSMLPLLN